MGSCQTLVCAEQSDEALHDIMVKCGTLKDDNAHIIVSTDGSRVLYDKDNPRTEVLLTCADDLFGITKG